MILSATRGAMTDMHIIHRRTFIKGGAALAASALLSARALAQSGIRTGADATNGLPARGEFVVRGATVLTMDRSIGDLPRGDVHVRDGEIVAIAPQINSRATTIDGHGRICMPGFIDTHWHLWTTVC